MKRLLSSAVLLIAAATALPGCGECGWFTDCAIVEPGPERPRGLMLESGDYDLVLDRVIRDECGVGDFDRQVVPARVRANGESIAVEAEGIALSGWQGGGALSVEGPILDEDYTEDREAAPLDDEGDGEVDSEAPPSCGTEEGPEPDPGGEGIGWIAYDAEIIDARRAIGAMQIVLDEDRGPGCEIEVEAWLMPPLDGGGIPDDRPVYDDEDPDDDGEDDRGDRDDEDEDVDTGCEG